MGGRGTPRGSGSKPSAGDIGARGRLDREQAVPRAQRARGRQESGSGLTGPPEILRTETKPKEHCVQKELHR